MLVGIAATPFPSATTAGPQSVSDSLPRAHCLDDGIIDAGGNHEPYIFVVRGGAQRRDACEQQQRNQCEALMRRSREQGVGIFHSHLYEGFGMTAEKSGMEDTQRAVEMPIPTD